MVGIFGAGMTHLRLADGRHLVIDNYTTAPAASRPDMFKPVSDTWPDYLRAEGDVNLVGLLSVGVPGTLKAWAEAVARFGRLDLETVMQPAIRHAERGFRATPYLVAAVTETAPDLARFPETARTFLPGGAPIKAGDLIAMPEYAATLRLIAAKGPGVLYGGDLGADGGRLHAPRRRHHHPGRPGALRRRSSGSPSAAATAASRSRALRRRPRAGSTWSRC